MQGPITKEQAREEFKVIGEVADKTIKKGARLTFQLGITVVTNGKNVSKKVVVGALNAMSEFLANAPKDWLFTPQIQVQTADVAGSDMQEELSARQQAKASIIKPTGLPKLKGKKVG